MLTVGGNAGKALKPGVTVASPARVHGHGSSWWRRYGVTVADPAGDGRFVQLGLGLA